MAGQAAIDEPVYELVELPDYSDSGHGSDYDSLN